MRAEIFEQMVLA